MGMSPMDYYSMLPREFAAKTEGYKRRIYYESSNQRKAAFIIIMPHIQDLSFEKYCRDFFPLQGDEKKETSDGFDRNVSPEIWEAIKKQKNAQQFENILQEHNKKLSKQRRQQSKK